MNSLIFTASDSSLDISYASFAVCGVCFFICIGLWKKWSLIKNPKVGLKHDPNNFLHKQGFDMKQLALMYNHPLEKTFPSPEARKQAREMRRGSEPGS
jgi:hypothetical protein